MTILKQSPSKNLRSKGFKVKHFLQISLLLAICFWLLHRVKNSYDWKRAYEEGTATQSEVQNELESIQLGRKDIHFAIQTTLEQERRQTDETKGNKPEESKDEGRGGGDEEIKVSDQEKSEEEEPEEVEDLIDEEDREREDENAEQESEEAENRLEDENLVVKPGAMWRRKWF